MNTNPSLHGPATRRADTKVASFTIGARDARIYHRTGPEHSTRPYIVKHFLNGIRQYGSDLETRDRARAIQAAMHWVTSPTIPAALNT